MSAGHLLRQAPLNDVLGAGGLIVTVTTPRPGDAVRVLRELGITAVAHDEVTSTVTGDLGHVPAEAIAPALVRGGVPLTGLDVSRPALEDYFVTLTGEGFDVAG